MKKVSMSDKLIAKTAHSAAKAAEQTATPERIKDQPPVTMPGQMGAFRLEAQRWKLQIDDLTSKLEDAEKRAVRLIALEDLHEVPGRRRKLTDEQFAELCENLRSNPLVTPITVAPRDEGGYEIISGNNRRAAYAALGKSHIEAIVRDTAGIQAEIDAFYANLLHPSLLDYEKYHGFKRREQQTGKSRSELAAEAGISPSTVTELFSFERLPEEVHRQLEEKPHILGLKAAVKLAQAIEAGKEELVIEAVQMLARDSKFTQVQAIAHATGVKSPAPARPQALVVRDGNQIFAKIVAKDNRIIVDLPKGFDPTRTVDLAKEFEDFLREKVKAGQQ